MSSHPMSGCAVPEKIVSLDDALAQKIDLSVVNDAFCLLEQLDAKRTIAADRLTIANLEHLGEAGACLVLQKLERIAVETKNLRRAWEDLAQQEATVSGPMPEEKPYVR